MFALANANPGPIWVTDVQPHQTKVRQQLQHIFPDQELSWRESTDDEHQNHPMTDDPQLLASNINPTSIVCFAYICMSLETTLNGYRPYRQEAMLILRGVKGRLHGDLCSLPVPEQPE